ncbi:MAG TPA: efflux RND transporter periplasmic adaptor subunit [Gemmatimonadales bacterium]|nr:efflux RND transporter periplasmic adaptor subunit [Gemmatimonadales bacterium]
MRLTLSSLVMGAVALAASGCGNEPAPARAEAPVTGLALVTVDTMTIEAPLALPSQLYVEHDAVVAARSGGTVDSVLADLGTKVEAGQLLAKLESPDQEIALAQAENADANAGQLARRMRELTVSGAATVADSEAAETQFRQAELAVAKARRDLALTRITAPFAGVVTLRMARPRRLVAPGDTLFRVTAMAPLLARVRVPEGAAADLKPGVAAQVVGSSGATASARVVQASPAIDPASGTREAVVELGPGSRLLPGASVMVRLGRERRRVIVVPRSSVGEDGYALVWENGHTALRAVTLGGDLDGGRVEVVSGLAPGERLARPGR